MPIKPETAKKRTRTVRLNVLLNKRIVELCRPRLKGGGPSPIDTERFASDELYRESIRIEGEAYSKATHIVETTGKMAMGALFYALPKEAQRIIIKIEGKYETNG